MPLSPQALIRGVVQRLVPTQNPDSTNNDVALRLETTGGLYTQPLMRKSHILADEGSYWVQNSGQSGITPPLGVAFSATVGAMTIFNADPLKRTLFLDYISLTNIVAVTCTTGTVGSPAFAAFTTDTINRLSSGGVGLGSPFNPNFNANQAAPQITITFGNLTLLAPVNSRGIVGARVIRLEPTASALTVIGDNFYFNFGGVEAQMANSPTITNPNMVPVPMPPIMIPYSTCGVLSIWWPNFTPAGGAAGFIPEVGYWLR